MHSSTFKTVNILVLEKNFKRGKKTQQLLFPKNERLILTMEQRKSLKKIERTRKLLSK